MREHIVNFLYKGSMCASFIKGKGKVVPVFKEAQFHEDVLGSGGIAPRTH